uniref:Uncharacterized protein n=1 Tax=Auxenochlorella protothecoides TaxID=3075 RepID=A0A1D2AGJ1_AUXPR
MPETSPTTLAAVEEAGARDRHVLLGLAFCTACVLGHYPWCRAARPQPPPRESPTQSTPRKRSRPNSPPLADGPPRTFPCAAAAPQASDNLPLSRRADSVMCDPQDPTRRPLSGPSPAEAHGEGAQAGRSDCQNFQLDKLDVVAGLLTDTASLESAGQGPCDEPLRLPPDGLLSPARSILLTSRSPDPSPTHGVLPGLGPEGSPFEGAGSPGSLTRALAKVSQLLDQLPADSWSVQRAACSARGEAEVCSLGRLPISGMRQECGDGGAGNRGQPRSPPGAVEGETQAPPPGSPGIMRAASDPASPSHRVSAPGSTTDPTSPASPASFTASACILSQESSTPRPLSRRVSFEDGINPDRRASPPAPEPAAWTDPSTSPPCVVGLCLCTTGIVPLAVPPSCSTFHMSPQRHTIRLPAPGRAAPVPGCAYCTLQHVHVPCSSPLPGLPDRASPPAPPPPRMQARATPALPGGVQEPPPRARASAHLPLGHPARRGSGPPSQTVGRRAGARRRGLLRHAFPGAPSGGGGVPGPGPEAAAALGVGRGLGAPGPARHALPAHPGPGAGGGGGRRARRGRRAGRPARAGLRRRRRAAGGRLG